MKAERPSLCLDNLNSSPAFPLSLCLGLCASLEPINQLEIQSNQSAVANLSRVPLWRFLLSSGTNTIGKSESELLPSSLWFHQSAGFAATKKSHRLGRALCVSVSVCDRQLSLARVIVVVVVAAVADALLLYCYF